VHAHLPHLKERAKRFDEDAEIQAAIARYKVRDPELEGLSGRYSRENAEALKERSFDRELLGRRGPGLERLDSSRWSSSSG
jgi:xylose isomerase